MPYQTPIASPYKRRRTPIDLGVRSAGEIAAEKPQDMLQRDVVTEIKVPDLSKIDMTLNETQEIIQFTQIFGHALARQAFGDDEYEKAIGMIPGYASGHPKPLPRRYLEGYKKEGVWYDRYGNTLPPPPEEFIGAEPGPNIVQRIAGFALGPSFENPAQAFRTILMGPEYERRRVLQDLILDVGLLAPFSKVSMRSISPRNIERIPGGRGLESFKRLLALPALPPRLVVKGMNRMLPEGKQVEHLLEGIWENIMLPPVKARWLPSAELGSKSIAEVFQPAVERMAPKVAEMFRTGTAARQLVSEAGQNLGARLALLNPKERFQALRGLLGGEVKGAAAQQVLKEFNKEFGSLGLRRGYKQEFAAALKKVLGSKTPASSTALENPISRNMVEEFFDLAADIVETGRTRPRKVRQKLDDIIGSPHVDDPTRTIAIELYDLTASTPEAVAEASKSVSKKMLVADLLRSGQARAEARAGYEAITNTTHQGFRELWGSYVPRDVWLELKAMQDIPKLSRRMYNKMFMTPWKTAKVILRPATHVRNIISNTILNDWGGLPWYRWDIYKRSLDDLLAYHRGRPSQYFSEFRKLTGAGGTFTINELVQLEAGLRHGATTIDKVLSAFDHFARVPRRLYNAEEQLFKNAKFIWNLRKGMSKKEAALDAMKWTFNYGEVTRFTALTRATIAPFFTWQSKVLPLMAETAVKHPMRFGKWIMFYELLQNQAIQNHGFSDNQWNYMEYILPDYIQDGQFLLLPWKDEQGRMQLLNLTYMIPGMGDIAEMYQHPAGWMFGSPLIGIGAALLHRTKYSGAPLYHDWESNKTKAAKAFSYIWKQLMPSWVPLGQDRLWERMWDSYQSNPDSLSWEQIMASQFGFKITPVDKGVAARKRRALEDIHLAQIDSQMRKELRQTRSPQGRSNIMKKYYNLRKELLGERSKPPGWYEEHVRLPLRRGQRALF